MTSYVPSTQLLECRDSLLGDTWSLEQYSGDVRAIAVRSDQRLAWLDARHDLGLAPEADLQFIASAREDVDALLASLQSRVPLSRRQLARITRRHDACTPGPWNCFLESGGGLGGANVVTMAGSQADLYLYLDGIPAPDSEWRFVALAHSEIPLMVDAVRALPRK